MGIESIIDGLKKIKLIPTIFLTFALYLFSIDLLTIILLGYEPKDYLYLIDTEKVLSSTILTIAFLGLIGLIIKKSFIASGVAVFIFASVYALVYDLNYDNTIKTAGMLFLIIAVFAFNIKEFFIDFFGDERWKVVIINIISGITISIILLVWLDNNFNNWNIVVDKDEKIEFIKDKTPYMLINTKSFNPVYLQKTSHNLKVYVYPELAKELSEKIYNQKFSNKNNFILVPHDNFQTSNSILTSNYYDVDDIKSFQYP